ncbi:hypothetical protein PanWU01x14_333670, partial [Parasponia andersonii]
FPLNQSLFLAIESSSLALRSSVSSPPSNSNPIKFLKFIINNSNDYVDCILWFNHLTSLYFTHRIPSNVQPIAASVNHFTSEVLLVREEPLSQGIDSNTTTQL